MKKIFIILFFLIACNNNHTKSDNNNLPFWEVKFFVNEFNEPTDVGYITNTNPILGKFYGNNISKSELRVKIMIKERAIGIKFYENNKEKAVKSSMQEPIEYELKIKHDNKLIDFNFRGIHENEVVIISDIISTNHQEKLINLLKKGGKFHFQFVANDKNKKIYDFEIFDPSKSNFKNLYSKLNK